MDSTLPHFKDSRELLLDVLMDVRLCALCECLSHLLSLSHDSILADEYSANLMEFPNGF